jgi:small subunit ribosomal protein S12
MVTYNQLFKNRKKKLKSKSKTILLQACPQKKGICARVGWLAPKKPNSARRKVAWVTLTSSQKGLICGIPGEFSRLSQYGVVLVRGGRTKDVPGLRYKIIRGKFDANSVAMRARARSKVGVIR